MTAPKPESTVLLNGPVLRFAMRVRGWSQAELARRIGIHGSTMSRVLRGDPTTWDTVRAIMTAFDRCLHVEEITALGAISPDLPPGALDVSDPAPDDADVIA